VLVCSELERQRDKLMDQRIKQQEAADRTNEARSRAGRGERDANRDTNRVGSGDAPEMKRKEQK
jgi:hypothetical protein